MKFEKRNFMGIELDVLVGHPEHELLFIATQAMRVSGLKDPASRIRDSKRRGDVQDRKLASLMGTSAIKLPLDAVGRAIKKETLFATEQELYGMMLRGHAPASEPFRKWVTEEVLPTIRKTGSYKAEDSQNPIALAIMDELKSLRGEIVLLRQELQAKTFSLEELPTPEVSPYEGQSMVALHDPAGFNEKTYRELAEYLSRSAVDRLEPRVELHI